MDVTGTDDLGLKLETVAYDLEEKARYHLDGYDHGPKKDAGQRWGSYVAFDMAAKAIRKALTTP
jgi:hypothetical protein